MMPSTPHILLHESSLSLKHEKLARVLTNIENLLIIQDLDGVCMGLVRDPLTRVIDTDYVKATQSFEGHFYVLTNGEHIGQRGVNGIIERAFGDADWVRSQGLYLPGLAAGGVQWQDRHGNLSYPGVSDQELQFLAQVPQRIQDCLQQFCDRHCSLTADEQAANIQASVLDNQASPTANLNTFHDYLQEPETYRDLQQAIASLMNQLLQEATDQGLQNSFFVHYAPNLGRDAKGQEIVWFAQGQESGTTDFQFMLRGAVKEAGVLAILNRYYFQRTGHYPLGPDFNARQAPSRHEELLELVKTHFDPRHMPVMVGVGDTVTSRVDTQKGQAQVQRGGSDRNFLQLIQDIGHAFHKGNIVVYVDSSHGEVKNRRPIKLGPLEQNAADSKIELVVLEGPCDPQDGDDPLALSVVFPSGHEQYSKLFQTAAHARGRSLQARHSG